MERDKTRHIARRLRMARQWRNLTLGTLAEQSGLSPARLDAYEHGRSPVPLDTLIAVSHILGLDPDYFFGRFPAEAPPRE